MRIQDRLARARGEEGMSLIEVMVAMMIFAILSTGLIYTMLSVISLGRDARARQVAANLAAGEIDLARDAASLFDLVSVDRAPRELNGDTFHVSVDTEWITDTSSELTCQDAVVVTSAAPLRYKRVNVRVTWDNMREGTEPVQADTVIDPAAPINDPGKGTIVVSVRDSAGVGRAGVNVSTSPTTGQAVPTTNSEGCTYVLHALPGTNTVTVSAPGYVDGAQRTTSTGTVTVGAGTSTSLAFLYDRAATYTATLAGNGAIPGVRVPTNLRTSFANTYGVFRQLPTSGEGTATQTFPLHPYAGGYQAYAGECDAADPGQWQPFTDAVGTSWSATRGPAVTAGPGGAAAVAVPTGIVTLTPGDGTSTFLKAVSATPDLGVPGCAAGQTVTYTFGAVRGTTPVSVALPYGTWQLFTGPTASDMPTPVTPAELTVTAPAAPTLAAVDPTTGIVTLDPRVVTP